LSIDSELSTKASKCKDKFLGGIYLHSICKRKSRAMQTLENLHEKSSEGKTTVEREREREIPLNQRDYKEFSVLYYRFNFLSFNPLQKRKRSIFIAKI